MGETRDWRQLSESLTAHNSWLNGTAHSSAPPELVYRREDDCAVMRSREEFGQ